MEPEVPYGQLTFDNFSYDALYLRFGQGSCAIEMSIIITVAA